MKAAQRGLLVFGIGAGILAAGLGVAWWTTSGGGPVEAASAASIGGDFSLVDQHGETRSTKEFRGKVMLIAFGYTYCPDVCPTELQTIGAALDQLGEAATAVQPLFVTIDPERDTPEQLRLYLDSFHPSFLGLGGTPEEVAAAARGYKVFYAKRPIENGEYLMDHSAFIFLVDQEGEYVRHFSPVATPEQIAAAVEKQL
jgi:cytochrome oxidase Cu insertion factor (SCO1/SenC/PrrC family)